LKIKLDENLSRHLKPALIQAGHETTTAADENLLGKPDNDVATAANVECRMVFTLDVASQIFVGLRRVVTGVSYCLGQGALAR